MQTSTQNAVGLTSDLSDELDVNKKMQRLLYQLTKDAARNSFSEYLELLGITQDEYEQIKNILKEKLNVDLYV